MKPEQTFITEYKSFVNQDKSQFSLQFYEDTKVYMISREHLDAKTPSLRSEFTM